MNENRRQILEMLAAGRINAEQAERLLAALDPAQSPKPGFSGATNVTFEGPGGIIHTVVDRGTRLVYTTASFGSKKVGGTV